MKEYAAAVDIGRRRDRYAEIVMHDIPRVIRGDERVNRPPRIVHEYHIEWVLQAGRMRFEEMENSVVALMNHAKLANNCDLLVDVTGVGDPVVERLRLRGLYPYPICFIDGEQVREVAAPIGRVFGDGAGALAPAMTLEQINVPRDDLIAAGAILMEQGRVRVAKDVKHRGALRDQLEGFRGTVNKRTGRVKYEAETEELHDDLVVCYLMLAWWLERRRHEVLPERELEPTTSETRSWEPLDYFVEKA